MPRTALAAAAVLLTTFAAGCGSEPPPGSGAEASLERRVDESRQPAVRDFPAAGGRSLQQIADTLKSGPKVGLATSTYVPGMNRLAFGLIAEQGDFVYGRTAVYVAPIGARNARRNVPGGRARGPFLAPLDPIEVEPAFRSRGSAHDALAGIYTAHIPLPRPGRYAVLTMTRARVGIVGAATRIEVTPDTPVADVGEPAPRVATDTVASAGGAIEAIETRVPPDRMHEHDLRDVLGRRPLALLFATPALCASRVCGPVTDIAAQFHAEYGDRMTFIHQEVYRGNDPAKGLREPLRAFGLRSEPWLFTIDRNGRIAARLEGAFGVNAFRRAVEAAL